ncbi:MAG: hypothetical protein ACRDLL_07690 [Solirubrobacterales bacterium]
MKGPSSATPQWFLDGAKSMHERRRARVFLSVLVGVVMAAVSASAASASPEWHFNGTLLPYTTQETVTAEATAASLTFPGLTTTCEPFVFELEVQNLLGGPGVGEVTGVPLSNCHTNSKFCAVETAEAENLPWPVHLTTIDSEHYFVIEGVTLTFLYGGELCALGETFVTIEGAAGGLVDDSTHSVTFNSTTMTAVGAQLKAFSQKTELNGTFSWFPTGTRAGLPLTVL